MKKLNNIILLSVITLSLSSCSAQEEKIVNLANITTNFNVAKFYNQKLKTTNETLAKDPKKIDKEEASKLLDNPFIVKDTLCYFKDGQSSDRIYIDSKSGWTTKKLKPIKTFGYAYKTVAWSEETDTIAVLNTVYFPKVDMIESEDGDFVMVKASKSEMKQAVIDTLERFLKSKYKVGKASKSDFSGEKISDYQNEDFIYRLVKMEKTYSVSAGEKSYFEKRLEIDFVIFNKKYLPIIKETGSRIGGENFEAYN
ncbi:hypothetical protein EZJ43_07915 [Pedobacter changchengzhani]|uniref:Lipoprotein n=1 Tax=Pedobacter changchengzhani TaxID=2529274 RepID=A0A4R5MLR8_9SPHI|nr:hypothetical protein [Pedobacter changchengzhani]TDG36436.1 hypothetical protein EZJ43_07915 [Pedobacter changchengzhani]